MVIDIPTEDTLTPTSEYMANVAVSNDEYLRRNPKWSKALKGQDSDKWKQADAKEAQQHRDKGTFKPIIGGKAALNKGTRVLPLKRQCKIKDSGEYKVRWVVLGNLDNFQGETYAPTACKKVVWLLYAVSILLNLQFQWFDVKGAFMAEKPTRDIYVSIDDNVYKLEYSLYGLDDAAKVFNDGLVEHMKAGGYVQSKWDQCFFYKWTSTTSYLYLVFHVDDFTAMGRGQSDIDEFHKHMLTKYEVTTNKDGIFLGTRCTRLPDGSMVFTKPHQLQNIFDKWLTEDMKKSTLPGEPMSATYIENIDTISPDSDKGLYKSLLGALMQLIDIRPDIAYAISKLAHRTDSPRESDMNGLLQIVKYLYGTRDRGLRLRPGDRASANVYIQLRGFADCGYANHLNGKSQYCVGFDLVNAHEHPDELVPLHTRNNTGMFYYKSWMAPTVDLSSTEGEAGVIVEGAKDIIFYRGLLDEMHQTQILPTPLYNDNKSTLTLATRYSGKHKRVRYMLPRINWLMEKSKEQIFKLLYLSSELLPADMGTKRHGGKLFQQKRDAVMGL